MQNTLSEYILNIILVTEMNLSSCYNPHNHCSQVILRPHVRQLLCKCTPHSPKHIYNEARAVGFHWRFKKKRWYPDCFHDSVEMPLVCSSARLPCKQIELVKIPGDLNCLNETLRAPEVFSCMVSSFHFHQLFMSLNVETMYSVIFGIKLKEC